MTSTRKNVIMEEFGGAVLKTTYLAQWAVSRKYLGISDVEEDIFTVMSYYTVMLNINNGKFNI